MSRGRKEDGRMLIVFIALAVWIGLLVFAWSLLTAARDDEEDYEDWA